MRLAGSASNCFWIRVSIILFASVGAAFLLFTQADAGLSVWNNDHSTRIRIEEERGMLGDLPVAGEARKKGLPVGLWGGEHISMQVTELRTTIEYDCAHGTIEQRISLDRRGRFDVSGTQVAERGGPVRQNEQLSGDPVRFTGQVSGQRMKLSVRHSVTKSLLGDFTLVHGVEGKLRKCM